MDIDKIIREWFFKLPMGYAEQPYSEDELQTLAEVLVEHKVDLPLFEATYKDNSENRKLGRVGQEWGTGKDAKPINKDTKKDSEEPKISKDDILQSLTISLRNISILYFSICSCNTTKIKFILSSYKFLITRCIMGMPSSNKRGLGSLPRPDS